MLEDVFRTELELAIDVEDNFFRFLGLIEENAFYFAENG
jgi:hypothetical protein